MSLDFVSEIWSPYPTRTEPTHTRRWKWGMNVKTTQLKQLTVLLTNQEEEILYEFSI